MRYLITGGAGFIGSHLIDALLERGDGVTVLDDLSTGRLSNIEHHLAHEHFDLVEGSVLDARAVEPLVAESDIVVHLASAVGVELIVDHTLASLQSNVRGIDTIVTAVARHHSRLLFASTSEVYGKQSHAALAEDCDCVVGSPRKARWSYAIAKSYGEALVSAYHRAHQIEAVVVRLFNTVGPRQTGAYGMVLPRFVRQALNGDDLSVYGNGTQTRCFVHVHDTVHALTLLMDEPTADGGVYNVGSGVETSIIELADRVIRRTESDSHVRLVSYEDAYGDGFEELGRRRPDVSAVTALTGWQPSRTVDDAIDDVIAFERKAGSHVAGAGLRH